MVTCSSTLHLEGNYSLSCLGSTFNCLFFSPRCCRINVGSHCMFSGQVIYSTGRTSGSYLKRMLNYKCVGFFFCCCCSSFVLFFNSSLLLSSLNKRLLLYFYRYSIPLPTFCSFFPVSLSLVSTVVHTHLCLL